MIALATVLSYIRVYKLPWGGSITLLSMLPIIIFSIKNGLKHGFFAAFVFSLIQFGQGVIDGLFGWGLTPQILAACIIIDYIGAYTILGIGGIFKNKGVAGWVSGAALAVFLRFMLHYASGVFIWQSVGELWGGFSTESSWIYSLIYNASYMLPELIFTTLGAFALFRVPQTRALLSEKTA